MIDSRRLTIESGIRDERLYKCKMLVFESQELLFSVINSRILWQTLKLWCSDQHSTKHSQWVQKVKIHSSSLNCDVYEMSLWKTTRHFYCFKLIFRHSSLCCPEISTWWQFSRNRSSLCIRLSLIELDREANGQCRESKLNDCWTTDFAPKYDVNICSFVLPQRYVHMLLYIFSRWVYSFKQSNSGPDHDIINRKRNWRNCVVCSWWVGPLTSRNLTTSFILVKRSIEETVWASAHVEF